MRSLPRSWLLVALRASAPKRRFCAAADIYPSLGEFRGAKWCKCAPYGWQLPLDLQARPACTPFPHPSRPSAQNPPRFSIRRRRRPRPRCRFGSLPDAATPPLLPPLPRPAALSCSHLKAYHTALQQPSPRSSPNPDTTSNYTHAGPIHDPRGPL